MAAARATHTRVITNITTASKEGRHGCGRQTESREVGGGQGRGRLTNLLLSLFLLLVGFHLARMDVCVS